MSEVDKSIYWCLLNGIIISNNGEDGSTIHAPFSLKPYLYPEYSFLKAQELAPLFNLLIQRVANNKTWILKTLQNVYLFIIIFKILLIF